MVVMNCKITERPEPYYCEMEAAIAEYELGFQSPHRELERITLPVHGNIPHWLSGDLIRNGPAIFSLVNGSYKHWFDGLAMLNKFFFYGGIVTYSGKFLASNAYIEALSSERVSSGEFATNPQRSFWERLSTFFKPELTDNANVNIMHIAETNRCFAMTETVSTMEFRRDDLATVGKVQFDDKMPGQITSAHPHFDPRSNSFYNILTNISRVSSYNWYRLDASAGSGMKRRPLISIPVKEPGYLHSFGMTSRYIVHVECPLLINPLELLLSGKPFIENAHWKPERGSRILLVDKETGSLAGTFETEAFFCFHHVNAFETNDEVCIDLSCYDDASIVDALYLKNLLHNRPPEMQLKRIRINLQSKKVTMEKLSQNGIELCRINYQIDNGKDYRIAYGVGLSPESQFLDRLLRIDVGKGDSLIWQQEHCYPGEPVFIANPNGDSTKEDNGVLLSLVLDAQAKKSFLLVLDAQTMTEIGRAWLPIWIPFGFHGQFIEWGG
jgi:carotenoid cleavage dioxygenase-like enzyme